MLLEDFKAYETVIATAEEAIRDCRLFHRWEWLSSDEVMRLAAIEENWQVCPDAVAEVLGIILESPLGRAITDIYCHLWRGGYRTANQAKPT